MTNNIPLSVSAIDGNIENPTVIGHQPVIHENAGVIPVSQNHEQKLSSSYLALSVGDNRHFGVSDFQDPLFYEQPLHFHYNQSIPSTIGSGHETGDRARLTNETKFNEYRKHKYIPSCKQRLEKKKSAHRRYTNSKKSKEKIIKAKEKKKKTSTNNMNKRKHKSKNTHRGSIQLLRHQSNTRQELLLKRRRQQQILLKKKKKLLQQRSVSKKRSMAKVNKKKSSASSQHVRKVNTTNNRMASTAGHTGIRSSSQSDKNLTASITQLIDDRIKYRTDISILDSIPPSATKHMMNEVTKHLRSKPSNIFSSSCIHPTLSSKAFSGAGLVQKLSKKNILRSKSNGRKRSTSKLKQRNRGGTKLNIRSPVHTTFKNNVRRHQKQRSTGRKTKFPRCTSKTLITIAPMHSNNENMIKPIGVNNDNVHTRTSLSLFSLKNSLTDKESSTSVVMPLTKNTAELTSKNNNRRISKIKRRRSNVISIPSGRKLIGPTKTGMTLRSRTIIINNVDSTRRKGEKV